MEAFDNLAVGGLDAAAAAEAMIFMSNLCKPEYAPAKEGASGDESGHSLTKKRRRTGAKTGSAAARNKKTKSDGAEVDKSGVKCHTKPGPNPLDAILAKTKAKAREKVGKFRWIGKASPNRKGGNGRSKAQVGTTATTTTTTTTTTTATEKTKVVLAGVEQSGTVAVGDTALTTSASSTPARSAGTTQAEPQPGVIVLHDPAQMLLAQMNAQIMSLRPLSVGGMQVSGLETAHSNAIAAPAKPYKAIPGSIFEWTSSHLGAYLTEAKQSGYSSDETSSDGNSSSSGSSSSGSSSSGSSGSSSSPDGYASRSPGSSSALPDVLAQSHRNPKSHIRFVTSEPEPYSLNALAAWPTDADGNLDDNEGLEEIEMMGTTTGYECLEMKPVVRYTFPESQANTRSWYIDDDGDVKR